MFVENSWAGLDMLPGEVFVTVNHEQYHQYAMARYRVPPGRRRHVAVELGWSAKRAGGERSIEVRLDGRLIGELTQLMSQRYLPVIKQVVAGGGRPGCEAVIQLTTHGLAVMLNLPRWTPDTTVQPLRRPARWRGLAWFAAAAVAVITVAAILAVIDARAARTTDGGVPATAVASSTVDSLTSPRCDPNYRGACVPVADDVDCADEGVGPVFVTGPIQVVGEDVYHLDPDKDGVACR